MLNLIQSLLIDYPLESSTIISSIHFSEVLAHPSYLSDLLIHDFRGLLSAPSTPLAVLQYLLLHDLPSLPRLNPERQRQVRVLWLFPSKQMSEQPPAFPNWSTSHAWLRTEDQEETKPAASVQCACMRVCVRVCVCSLPGGWRLWWYTCSAPPLSTLATTWCSVLL